MANCTVCLVAAGSKMGLCRTCLADATLSLGKERMAEVDEMLASLPGSLRWSDRDGYILSLNGQSINQLER